MIADEATQCLPLVSCTPRRVRRTHDTDIPGDRHRNPLFALAWLVLFALLLSAPSAHGQQDERPCLPLPTDATIRVDMKDVPLDRVIRLISCSTETAFIFSAASLKQLKVTFVAPRPVARNELFSLLDGALSQHQLVRERRGPYEFIRRAQPPSKRRSSKGR